MHKHESKITERDTTLVARLKELDSARVKFFDAKKLLLEEGYSEKEIAKCLYIFSYDGIPNKPKKEDPVTKYYTQSPEEAERVAQYILKHQRDGEFARAAAQVLAARYAPGPHARAHYSGLVADFFGYPILTAILSVLPGILAVVTWGVSPIFIYLGPLLVTVYWLIKTIHTKLR